MFLYLLRTGNGTTSLSTLEDKKPIRPTVKLHPRFCERVVYSLVANSCFMTAQRVAAELTEGNDGGIELFLRCLRQYVADNTVHDAAARDRDARALASVATRQLRRPSTWVVEGFIRLFDDAIAKDWKGEDVVSVHVDDQQTVNRAEELFGT